MTIMLYVLPYVLLLVIVRLGSFQFNVELEQFPPVQSYEEGMPSRIPFHVPNVKFDT